MTKYKVVTLYDAEKNYMEGNGKISIHINADKFKDDAELDDYVAKLKAEQREKNKAFNEEMKTLANTMQKNVMSKVIYKPTVDLKLDPNTGNSTLILGSSKRGKSTLLMYLFEKYYSNKNFISILFSINAHIDLYKNNKRLIKCKTFNKETQKLIYKEKFINSKTNNKYEFINMLDDIIDIRFNKVVDDSILTLRNSKISTIISTQYCNLISKSARSSANNVFLFGFNTNEAVVVAINMFLAPHFTKMGFNTLNDQIQLYNDITKDHGFMYLKPESGDLTFHKLNLK